MPKKKTVFVFVTTVLCILMNLLGKEFANRLSLPLWLDSFGTILIAYLFGPVCGAIVGAATNITYAVVDYVTIIYGITNVAIGICVGIAARKKMFESFFGAATTSVILTFVSVLISLPLNFVFWTGQTGNMWGDGVIAYLVDHNVNIVIASAVGEFYVDFVDKSVMLILLFASIKLYRSTVRGKMQSASKAAVLLLAAAVGILCMPLHTQAAPANESTAVSEEDYASYLRTIYNGDNGLLCGEANDIVSSKDGVLWIGTYSGLYRYSGSEFRWMSEYESVKNVNCLYLDDEGRIWIGTNDNGLSILINERIVNVVDEEAGLPSNSVRDVVESSQGLYYIATSDSMQLIDLNGGLNIIKTIDEIHYGSCLTADEDGHVATVTSNGDLFLLSGEFVSDSVLADEENIYTSCVFAEDGKLYVGTAENIIRVFEIRDHKLKSVSRITCTGLRHLNCLNFVDGNLFVCADNGIGYLNKNNKLSIINTEGFNNSIDNMVEDYQNNLWFASSRMGLLRMCKSQFSDLYSKLGITNNVVNAVTFWQGDYYIGTDRGLDIIDGKLTKQINNELTELLDNVRIRCLSVDSFDSLWICTYGKGLIEVSFDGTITTYDSSSGAFGNRARVVLEMEDGTIAASGDTGITLIRGGKVVKTFLYGEELENAMILSLMEDTEGRLIAGSDGDGIYVIENDKVTAHIGRKDGLSSGVILRTIADKDNDSFFVVTSNGLCYMDNELNVRVLNNSPYYNNYDIWENSYGQLFLLGSAGIYIVRKDDLLGAGETVEYELLNAKAGLNSALVANSWGYLNDNGALFLCTDQGVYELNIDNYSQSKRSYRMMLSTAKLDDVTYPISRNEEFFVGRDVTRLELYPEVLNYGIDDPHIMYYLEGFDNSYFIVNRSELQTITYTNLPYGEYVFHMAVLDSEQENILEEATYRITKEKAIYDNAWFRAYILLVMVMAVAWFTWFIVRTQIQRTLNFQRKELEFAREQVQMGNQTILAIAKTVDAKDVNTSQHSTRVSEYSVLLGTELGLSEADCESLGKAALLHDIGKIGIPDKILNKNERLTDEEYEIMKTHVSLGAEILKDFTLIDNVSDGVLYHHERYDGKGYVHGLKGEEIPLFGRIIGVADAFDAMTANRVYRKKLTREVVLSELQKGRGTQFDPSIIDILLRLIDEGVIELTDENVFVRKEQK